MIHAKIGRVSYKSVGNLAWGVPFCSTLETCAKSIQNLYNSSRPPTANNRISAPTLRPESARKHAPAAPPLPPLLGRFFAQSDASLLMHCFRTVFRPFSLWSGPQFPVMHHFLGKCNTFAALFPPLAAPPRDRPSAIKLMNRRPPQTLSETGEIRASPPAPASQHAHMKAPQIVTNFHISQQTTTPQPASNTFELPIPRLVPVRPQLDDQTQQSSNPDRRHPLRLAYPPSLVRQASQHS